MTRLPDPVLATVNRLRAVQSCLEYSDAVLVERYWRLHPRFRFVKTLPRRAALLDVGAGAGGLAYWRLWGTPPRPDLRFFGIDREPRPVQPAWQGWESLDLDTALPSFPGRRFDGAVMSHVIEHLRDPLPLLRWLRNRLRPGAGVYIEWPGPASLRQPRREDLLDFGIDLTISNYFDDATHRTPMARSDVADWLAQAGFTLRESGTIDLGAIGTEMLARGLRDGDQFMALCGFWSLTGWAERVVAEAVR